MVQIWPRSTLKLRGDEILDLDPVGRPRISLTLNFGLIRDQICTILGPKGFDTGPPLDPGEAGNVWQATIGEKQAIHAGVPHLQENATP